MRAARRLLATATAALGLVFWSAAGALVGLVLVLGGPLVVGWRPMTEMSDSMRPLLRSGDVVVVAPIAARAAGPGDVVAFADPLGSGRTITHRVITVRERDGRLHFVTRGDANSAPERWTVASDGRIGRVVFRLPRIGLVLRPLAGRAGRLLLVALPLALLCLLELWQIWRPEREHPREGAAA